MPYSDYSNGPSNVVSRITSAEFFSDVMEEEKNQSQNVRDLNVDLRMKHKKPPTFRVDSRTVKNA